MALVRLKYRPSAVQPEMNAPNENISMSLARREKEPEVDPYHKGPPVRHDPPIFLCTHTQVKRVEIFISSDEEALRKKQYPTIHERVELQKDWAKQQLTEQRVLHEREALKKMMDAKILAASQSDTVGDDEASVEFDLGEEEEEVDELTGTETDAKYAAELTGIKERKLLMMRNTASFHTETPKFQVTKLAWRVYMGWLGKSDKTLTTVLPWLLIGRRETSGNMQLLLKLGVTHILNVTHDLPNLFNAHFVYQRISVRDNNETDIGSKFSTAIAFIKRVEEVKGRLLVHCTAGASRAPTIVLAYLVFAKKIALVDAFNYLTAIRPLVAPNKHFLFQLAMLEVQYGEGCSVYFHKEWRFYEFNTFRAQAVESRKSIGLFRTVKKLYGKQRDDDDILGV